MACKTWHNSTNGTAIVDQTGTVVTTYLYDAWGNHLHTTGSLSATVGRYNPLRYRGYVYDRETKLYYLQSRYYNPETGRFINGDGFTTTGQGLIGNNMFAYCGNNPVNRVDARGTIYERTAGGGYGGGGGLAINTDWITEFVRTTAEVATVTVTATATVVAVSVADLDDFTTDAIREEMRRFRSPGPYSVYVLSDPVTQEIEYVGRTKNPVTRKAAHSRNPARMHLEFTVKASGLTLLEARGMEQVLLTYCETLNKDNPMNNQINGISPYNANKYDYLYAAKRVISFVDNSISNEILNFLGI